jgi:hypothetical protein
MVVMALQFMHKYPGRSRQRNSERRSSEGVHGAAKVRPFAKLTSQGGNLLFIQQIAANSIEVI